MKRLLSFLLVVVVIATMAVPVLADKKDKGKEFKELKPNKLVTKDEFFSSFSSLLKDYGYSWDKVEGDKKLTRGDMALIVGRKLIEEKLIPLGTTDVPFKDIKNMSKEDKKVIMALYEKGIIKGKTKNTYNPNSKVSIEEAKKVLERVEELLEETEDYHKDKRYIPFKLIGTVESSRGEERTVVKEEKNRIILSITKEFPTSGYSIEVDKIKKVNDKFEVDLSIFPPKKEAYVSSVITYVTTNVEIDRAYLGKGPYKFYLIENVRDLVDKNIPFKVKETVESYNGKEGIVVEEEKGKLLVSITKKFSTSGYSMAVEKIVANNGKYEVYIIIAPPRKDTFQLQAITYKTINIEMDREDMGNSPYNFVLKSTSI